MQLNTPLHRLEMMDRSGLLPLWADMEKKTVGVLHGLRASRPGFIIIKKLQESRAGVALRNLLIPPL